MTVLWIVIAALVGFAFGVAKTDTKWQNNRRSAGLIESEGTYYKVVDPANQQSWNLAHTFYVAPNEECKDDAEKS